MTPNIPRPDRLVRIEQWSVQVDPYKAPEDPRSRIFLRGNVYGYPGRPDGHPVDTGHIYGAEGRVAWGRRTAYELGEPEPAYLAWLEANGVPFDAEQPIKMVVRS